MADELLTTTEEVTTDEVVTDSSEEIVETAEPQESEQSVEEPTQQTVDVNAIAAAARRKAEAEARNIQSNIDAEYVRRFGHLTNPKTGAPIRSQADYLAALDAQEEMKAKAQLEQSGIDPQILDNAIANNPLVRQAQMVMEANNKQNILMQINNDVAELGSIDPSITSLDTVPPDVINYSMQTGINLVNAYKILNFGRISEGKQAAITQNAINQAKGKQHLSPVNGVATPEEGVEIPKGELAMWKEVFPDKSNAELKKLYNNSLSQ